MAGGTVRRTAVGLALVALGLSTVPAVAEASNGRPVEIGGQTTLVGAHAVRHVVQVPEPATVDLELVADESGQVLPAALSVTGGHGFRGFLLTEPGRLDGVVTLAVALPEPDHTADGAQVHGTAWGQSSAGERCVRCTVPAGTYELYLLTGGLFDDSPSHVEVSMRVDGLSGHAQLDGASGQPIMVFQHAGNEMTSPDDALLGGGGWASSWAWKSAPWTGVLIDQMAVSYTGRMAPPVLTNTEFCREIGEDRDCDQDTNALSDHHTSQVQVMPFDLPAEATVSSSLVWDVVGNADYRAIKNVMFVDIGHMTTIEADEPDENRRLHTLFQAW